MKRKIIAFVFVIMLVTTSSFVITPVLSAEEIEKVNEDSEISIGYNVLSDDLDYSKYISDLESFQQSNSGEGVDQSCENGDEYEELYSTSEHLAQSFKPSKNVFTSLKLYLKRSTSTKFGWYIVFIRNDSLSGDKWLVGIGWVKDIPTEGGWVTFNCLKHYELDIDRTYYIVIDLYFIFPKGAHFDWRYSDENPYSRGKAWVKKDDINWEEKSNCDFNFQTWGIDTRPPNEPSKIGPGNGVEPQDVKLEWDCSDPDGDPIKYDVYFGTSTPPSFVTPNHPNKYYDPDPDYLFFDTTYYWRIVARDSNGAENIGPIWNFYTKDAPDGPPVVNYIETKYADGSKASSGVGLLLQGLDLENTYKAFIAGHDVDKVQFDFSDFGLGNITDDDGSDGWTATINTQYMIWPSGEFKIRAHSTSSNPEWGEYKSYSPKVIPLVGWLANYIQCLTENELLDYVTFEVGIKGDERPINNFWILEASIDLSSDSPGGDSSPIDVDVNVPKKKIGGNYGYSGGIGSSIILCSDGTITVSGEFHAEVEAKSFSGGISASLYGNIVINEDKKEGLSVDIIKMFITINGEVTIPVFIIPFKVCGVGVEAGIEITPSVSITFQLEATEDPSFGLIPGLGIKLKDDGGTELEVAFKVIAYAEAGFVIGDFYAEAGGKGTLYLKTESPYLDNFILDAWIGGRIRFLFWTAEGWWRYTWSLNKNNPIGEEYEETEWQKIDRDYAIGDEYNKYVWENSDKNEYGRMIENSFPHAKPCIAPFPDSAGNELLMVWAHDNVNKSVVEGMELQYTTCTKTVGEDGVDIDPPDVIPGTDDDKLQMDPQVAFDSNGNAICVFVQTPSNIDESSSYYDAAVATELAYCVWDVNTETWGSINIIGNTNTNNRMDVQPVLQSNNNGDIILLWTSDVDCDVDNYNNPDTTITDRSIYAAFWDGNSWSAEETLASNEPIVTTPNVAVKDGTFLSGGNLEGLCVFTMDEDNDPETTDDQNVSYININQGTKDYTIHQFTTDSIQDTSPSVVYGTDGNPYIIWLKSEYHTENNTDLYDGTLYYQSIGARSDPKPIKSGRLSDPVAVKSAGTKRNDALFHVGWVEGGSTYTLNYADISPTRGVDDGVIYGCESKLSETDWSIAPGAITVSTIERPQLKGDNKSCNLTFVLAPGYDQTIPITSCSLNATPLGYGINGPRFKSDVIVTFDATDKGGAGIERTEYRIDYGGWITYDDSEIIISDVGKHLVQFRSIDKAGNLESTKSRKFEIFISNAPRRPESPDGPSEGKAGKKYSFIGSTTDPDDDNLYYKWRIEGYGHTEWLGPYSSRKELTVSVTWHEKGTYNVYLKAMDINGLVSEESPPHRITIPRSRSVNNPLLLKLIEKILLEFPILERIFSSLQFYNKLLNY